MIGIEGKVAIGEEETFLTPGVLPELTELCEVSAIDADEKITFEMPVTINDFQGSSESIPGNENRDISITAPLFNCHGIDRFLKWAIGEAESYQGTFHHAQIGAGNGINKTFDIGSVYAKEFIRVDEFAQSDSDYPLLESAMPRNNLSAYCQNFKPYSKLKVQIDSGASAIINKPVIIEGKDETGADAIEVLYFSLSAGSSQTKETTTIFSVINHQGISAREIDPGNSEGARLSIYRPAAYITNKPAGTITFNDAPPDGSKIYFIGVIESSNPLLYTHIIKPAFDLIPFSIGIDEVLTAYQFYRCYLGELSLSVSSSNYAELEISAISSGKEQITFPSLSGLSDKKPFLFSETYILFDDIEYVGIEDLGLKIQNNLDYQNLISGNSTTRGQLDISFTFKQTFDDQVLMDKYLNLTLTRMMIGFEKPEDKVIFDIPAFQVQKYKKPLEGTDFIEIETEGYVLKRAQEQDKIRVFIVNGSENI